MVRTLEDTAWQLVNKHEQIDIGTEWEQQCLQLLN